MRNLLTRALSLSIITIVADKGSFSRDQACIKKRPGPGNDTDLHQNKKKSRSIDYLYIFISHYIHIHSFYISYINFTLFRISPNSVQVQENTDQYNSEYGQFLRSFKSLQVNLKCVDSNSDFFLMHSVIVCMENLNHLSQLCA